MDITPSYMGGVQVSTVTEPPVAGVYRYHTSRVVEADPQVPPEPSTVAFVVAPDTVPGPISIASAHRSFDGVWPLPTVANVRRLSIANGD